MDAGAAGLDGLAGCAPNEGNRAGEAVGCLGMTRDCAQRGYGRPQTARRDSHNHMLRDQRLATFVVKYMVELLCPTLLDA
jgi:hypothetical protein